VKRRLRSAGELKDGGRRIESMPQRDLKRTKVGNNSSLQRGLAGRPKPAKSEMTVTHTCLYKCRMRSARAKSLQIKEELPPLHGVRGNAHKSPNEKFGIEVGILTGW